MKKILADWCYSLDGESYIECDNASSREEAIAEASEHARAHGRSSVFVSMVRRFRHVDLVAGIGPHIREYLQERAVLAAGEHAEDYPEVHDKFDLEIERQVLALLNQRDQPTFFQAANPFEVPVKPAVVGWSCGPDYDAGDKGKPFPVAALTPEQERQKLLIAEAREAAEASAKQQQLTAAALRDAYSACKHPVFIDADGFIYYTRRCAICDVWIDTI